MYRTIDTMIWADPKIRQLPLEGKCLFVYLITHNQTHASGLYHIPDVLICHELGLAQEVLDALWQLFAELHLALRDPERALVWVVNMLRYQAKSPTLIKSAARNLQKFHQSPLAQAFRHH